MSKKKGLFAFLLGVFVAIILWMTVFGRSQLYNSSFYFLPFHTFINIEENIKKFEFWENIIGNALMFVPIGILYHFAFDSNEFQTLRFGFLISLSIEFLQMLFHKGYFEIDDILFNTFGTYIGILVYLQIRKIFQEIL